jgi:NADPH:quinone reductase-like Zn-dependent oxidoreductase
MKAAIIASPGKAPVYGDFAEPSTSEGREVITVSASALSQFSKSRSSGSHYSSSGEFPLAAGAEGVGRTAEGRRVYFALPETPYGALAEKSLVRSRQCVAIPDDVDDITAAAIANPGMSAWAALVARARLQPGETVLVNGATGTAGRLAVQLAKYLGAGKVIATGRNTQELESLKPLGADVIVPFELGALPEKRLEEHLAEGIDVVIDYLWGNSAETIIGAIARSVEDATPVRFVHVGGASGEENIKLPGAALRSSAIVLMGSGVKSVPIAVLLDAVGNVFAAVNSAQLQIAKRVVPLSEIASVWGDAVKPRVVITVG